jgi:glycosyltransferase involved in cell wall biosynthesis
MKLIIQIPCLTEEQTLPVTLADLPRELEGFSSVEWLVVDDGSTDRTPEILSTETDLRIITHETNQGYGAALRNAFEYAAEEEYDVLVTIDCDGQHEPRLIPDLAAAVFPPDGPPVDIVSGSRYLRRFEGDSAPPEERRRINVEITRLLNERLGLSLTDSFCGFKAYRVEALRKLRITEPGYAMPLQLWVQAAALGLRIAEFPVPLIYLEEERSFGGSLDDARRRLAYYREVLDREMAASSLPCG